MDWKEIETFPGYSVSDGGVVRNDNSGRVLVQMQNQGGMAYVGMSRGGQQYKRSVSALVARAFLPSPIFSAFDHTINLDGNRSNNHVSNLAWRSFTFSRRYHRQLLFGPQGPPCPVVEVDTHEEFETSWVAALRYGLLDQDIIKSIINRTCVFPTFQTFRFLEE